MTRGGFTLVELLVAVTLAGLTLVMASSIFLAATESVEEISARSASRERQALARAWLTQALNGAAVTSDPVAPFRGSDSRMRFRSVLWVPQGWLRPRDVTVSIADRQLRLDLGSGPDIVLIDSFLEATFDYADSLGASTPWLRGWDSFAGPPLAVRLRIVPSRDRVDTLLIYVGER